MPAEIYEAEGFTSRKTMKSEMYSRAAVSKNFAHILLLCSVG